MAHGDELITLSPLKVIIVFDGVLADSRARCLVADFAACNRYHSKLRGCGTPIKISPSQ